MRHNVLKLSIGIQCDVSDLTVLYSRSIKCIVRTRQFLKCHLDLDPDKKFITYQGFCVYFFMLITNTS